jgi:citronellol/citronellal dehydrogenase
VGYQSIFKEDLFAGRTVVITGGGSGIGRCTSHELAALGANVAIVGRSAEKLEAVQAEIRADGGRVSVHAADIRDEATVSDVIDAILTEHGRIDGLFNNAGGQYRAPLETISTKGFEAVVRNNLTGGFIVMREVYAKWMKAHGGAIVNMIADIWHGWPHFAHSAAARGGMLTLSESAATEWAAAGVRVNTIAPGSIASSGLDTYDSKDTDFIRNEVAHTIPLQRFGTEAEVSAAVVFLLSPAQLHHRDMHPCRRWSAECQAGVVGTASRATQHSIRRVPPLLAARHPRRQPAELVITPRTCGG